MYKANLALNNLQWLISIKPNQIILKTGQAKNKSNDQQQHGD